MKINSIASWYGSNRMLASNVGHQLGKLAWCGIPFCGGGAELPHIKTRDGVANDLHRHIINLARVIKDPVAVKLLISKLDHATFHPDELKAAQILCTLRGITHPLPPSGSDIEWAAAYFICSWMCRGESSGTKSELTQSLSIRYTSSGGSSPRRFRSAVDGINEWHHAIKDWAFICEDAFDFLESCKDRPDHGIYIDAPWPDAGASYKHSFDDDQQRRLAGKLAEFSKTRVVVRFGDHPLIRALYPRRLWHWLEQTSRNQANDAVPEFLIINGAPYPCPSPSLPTSKPSSPPS